MYNTFDLSLTARPQGFHLVTSEIVQQLPELPKNGIIVLFIKHTSASLTLNENADPDVRSDFAHFFKRLVPNGTSYFMHKDEGDDDMPAHIKTSLLGASLTIPIKNHRLNLGIWQGIYLCEFRNHGSSRQLSITLIGE